MRPPKVPPAMAVIFVLCLENVLVPVALDCEEILFVGFDEAVDEPTTEEGIVSDRFADSVLIEETVFV
jgi:hypothetical protein